VIPPLRERREDIEALSKNFISQFCKENGLTQKTLDDSALEFLLNYSWPGNIRELKSVIKRSVLLSEKEILGSSDIYLQQGEFQAENVRELNPIEKSEKELILEAMKRNNGNISKTSRELGIGRSTLYRKLKKYSA
jgi:DNA-binding NtrC family response regulator